MALKGLDIFKLTPKKNCKECGSPTCMAFSMKVASGAVPIEKCPYMSADALATLSEATAPLMKTIEVGTGNNAFKLGGEPVLFRHEKTLVNRNRYAVCLSSDMDEAAVDAKLAEIKKVDYERIGEREYVEFLYLDYAGNGADAYVALVNKAAAADRAQTQICLPADAAAGGVDRRVKERNDAVFLILPEEPEPEHGRRDGRKSQPGERGDEHIQVRIAHFVLHGMGEDGDASEL